MTDEAYMQRCFDLAIRGLGHVSPNPLVGAVLVCNGIIIGEGWHQAWGQAHAEVNCFRSVSIENQALIPKSTLYCSLEPCAHFGKTPPCVDLILKQKVARVVVSNTDPNPLVAGKGLAKLRAAGVDVTEGVLEPEGAWLNRAFFTWIIQKRPFILLKWAQTADGFLGKQGERTNISGPLTQRLVHRWRAASDAILVGAATATVDDPRLDVRYYFGKSPRRVLLDGKGTVPTDRQLLSDPLPTLIFGAKRLGIPIQKTLIESTGNVSLEQVLEVLQQENCATLLVEGGANTLLQFMEKGLWDEIRVIENPRRLGVGIAAPTVPANALLLQKFTVGTDLVSVFCQA
jgi:diaminohydroxyphosphoribosylaminopyrimidine deaminase/5-amino-6-(5-phosphoribosylamino)uracil reductase